MSGLAQIGDLGPALLMLGVLLAIVLAAGGVLIWVRSRTLGSGGRRGGAGLFEDLGRMRDAGEISAEEYAAARRSVVDRLAGRSGTDRDASELVRRRDARSDLPE